jgi:hypothetical protein
MDSGALRPDLRNPATITEAIGSGWKHYGSTTEGIMANGIETGVMHLVSPDGNRKINFPYEAKYRVVRPRAIRRTHWSKIFRKKPEPADTSAGLVSPKGQRKNESHQFVAQNRILAVLSVGNSESDLHRRVFGLENTERCAAPVDVQLPRVLFSSPMQRC